MVQDVMVRKMLEWDSETAHSASWLSVSQGPEGPTGGLSPTESSPITLLNKINGSLRELSSVFVNDSFLKFTIRKTRPGSVRQSFGWIVSNY